MRVSKLEILCIDKYCATCSEYVIYLSRYVVRAFHWNKIMRYENERVNLENLDFSYD